MTKRVLSEEEECLQLKKMKITAIVEEEREKKEDVKMKDLKTDGSCEGEFCARKKKPNKAKWYNHLTSLLECDWCSHAWISSSAGLQSLSPNEFGTQLIPITVRDHFKLHFSGYANGALKYYFKNDRGEMIKVFVAPPTSLYLYWNFNNDNPDKKKEED